MEHATTSTRDFNEVSQVCPRKTRMNRCSSPGFAIYSCFMVLPVRFWQGNHAFEWNEGKATTKLKHYMENKEKIAEKKKEKYKASVSTMWPLQQ